MPADTYPDIRDGHILNGSEKNYWMTEIQSMTWHKGEQVTLAHECQNEHVPLSESELGGGNEIFQTNRPFPFLTATKGEQFYQVFSHNFLFNDLYNIQGAQEFSVPAMAPEPTGESTVRAPERPIEKQALSDLLEALAAGAVTIRDLFLHIGFTDGDGDPVRIITPVRYINFSEASRTPYVQPISGTVLMPDDQGRLVPGYIACAVSADRTIAEFAAPKFMDYWQLLNRQYPIPQPLGGQLGQALVHFPMALRLNNNIQHLQNPEVSLYSYL